MELYEKESAIRAIQNVYTYLPGIRQMLEEADTKQEARRLVRDIKEEMKKDVVPKGIIKAAEKLLIEKYVEKRMK